MKKPDGRPAAECFDVPKHLWTLTCTCEALALLLTVSDSHGREALQGQRLPLQELNNGIATVQTLDP